MSRQQSRRLNIIPPVQKLLNYKYDFLQVLNFRVKKFQASISILLYRMLRAHPPIYIYIYIYMCVCVYVCVCVCVCWSTRTDSCVLRTSIDKIKENGFKLTKERSSWYPAKTITEADYADDIALLANTPAQAETLLHSLKRAASGKYTSPSRNPTT